MSFRFVVLTAATFIMNKAAHLSLPFKIVVLTAGGVFHILSFPFKFKVFTRHFLTPMTLDILSLPFKFVALTTVWQHYKNVYGPVTAFQIRGAYSEQEVQTQGYNPVATFQIQGVYKG